MPRLRRSSCSAPGISRRRRGRGHELLDPDGRTVDDPEVLERVAALSIPPAWRDVWICMDPRGHLQATGVDAAGRKQYLYHGQWRAHRDRQKFDSMIAFGRALPRLRRRVSRDLRRRPDAPERTIDDRLARDRVLACAVRLLDVGFFRIGSDDYAERNDSYGLTTMLRRHVSIDGNELVFDFPAKSGQRRVQAITDADALEVVADLKRRRAGEQLLAYREDGHWVELAAEEVNDYLKRHSGGDFTAKDFRTWNATVLASVALAVDGDGASTRAARERRIKDAVRTVAAYLGNTPAVCRASYVDPRVIDRYQAGVTIAPTLVALPAGEPDLANARSRTRIEVAVLELLDDAA
ncbi:MAG TPA: DNA topoisomerase IB [Solirubrobacteraceae bacterium]|nr:DNA topoisomerase IB [Solirubrobacteraceae bacterium]